MQLPLVPVYDNIVGYVDILDDVHFEIEFTIHSWPSGDWGNIFQCGTENIIRYPIVMIHPDSSIDGDAQEGLWVQVNDGNGNDAGGMMGDALSLETLYHVEVDFTQNRLTVVINDVTLYDGDKPTHPTTYNMPCYSGFPHHSAANVTITALSMSSSMFILSMTDGQQCNSNYNLGTGFANHYECALAAMEEPLCATNEILWSDIYNDPWGCRCCLQGTAYLNNSYWDTYRYGTCFREPQMCIHHDSSHVLILCGLLLLLFCTKLVENSHWIAAGNYLTTEWTDNTDYEDISDFALCTASFSNQSSESGPVTSENPNFVNFVFNIVTSCCETDGSSGARPDCSAYPKTYHEAKQICEDNGYRLCTLQELLVDRKTSNNGCQFDNAWNWVSDRCTPEPTRLFNIFLSVTNQYIFRICPWCRTQ